MLRLAVKARPSKSGLVDALTRACAEVISVVADSSTSFPLVLHDLAQMSRGTPE